MVDCAGHTEPETLLQEQAVEISVYSALNGCPHAPLGMIFGFSPLPISFLLLVGIIVMGYIISAENGEDDSLQEGEILNNAEVDLRSIAQRAMLDRGFPIQFPAEAQTQSRVESEPAFETLKLPDLTSWMWSSIDNDDSRGLDQIEYAKKEKGGTRIYRSRRCGLVCPAELRPLWTTLRNTTSDQQRLDRGHRACRSLRDGSAQRDLPPTRPRSSIKGT